MDIALRTRKRTRSPSEDFVDILPARGVLHLGLGEVWAYRELLLFFIWRDVKVRYKQTFFGAAWAIIQPFVLMIVFSVFVGNILNVPTPRGLPYPILAYTALVPWTLFAQSLSVSSLSLAQGANLVRKIYFPRLILPISATGAFIIDFGIALTVLFGMMLYYDIPLSANVVWLPVFTLLALVTALAVGIWLSALNARYRDVQHSVAFLVQIWLFASPIAYTSNEIPEAWRNVYFLNPMAGVIDGFRWALLDTPTRPGLTTLLSAGAALVFLVGGLMYFRNAERTFADVI